ncbi:type II secretion system protein [Pseudoduganella buxea]|uniref:Prepilin-type N-terminal cleavage/methylation domain-containing protein n=1 Tax=Pseudoduganella buxea TaxID=1949069 RepID=A0A6I3SWF8_9BURK|nr:prepilin-type N-terminal cleavage/methylation domain-containing protein [Pseudoduganella buxea]MTV52037.1 prepilin-type N-terminal cleavage/methylation domain-containing protein [Pseudoduganella buxea]GGB92552.1 type II secretion system pseudopilin OxpG [Pseudoduganella buxea]
MAFPTRPGRPPGFTILELLVVLAIIGTLLSLAAPRYFRSIEKSRHAVLRENLATLRGTLDRFHADQGSYPDSLDELVARRYLRRIPDDPVTNRSDTWIVVAPAGPAKGQVGDIRSGAPGSGDDGVPFRDW